MPPHFARLTHAELVGLMSRWETDRSASAFTKPDTCRQYRFRRIESGFSGAIVFHVSEGDASESEPDLANDPLGSPSNQWALKAFPGSVPVERLMRNAMLIRHAAGHCGLLAPPQIVPDSGLTFFDAHGFHWELSPWFPGHPLTRDAPPDSIEKGGEAIGKVHQALAMAELELPLLKPRGDAGLPRCIADRIARIRFLTGSIEQFPAENRPLDSLAAALATQLSGENAEDPESRERCRQLAESLARARELLTRRWGELAPRLLEQLTSMRHDPDALRTSWVLRDVHRGHLLFEDLVAKEGDSWVRCVLDYDALDCDSPAADLARWSGDFAPEQKEPISATDGITTADASRHHPPLDAAVAGYRRVCAFSDGQRRLASVLTDVNSVGGLANWLVWLTQEARQFEGTASGIQGRIAHFIASVCRIC